MKPITNHAPCQYAQHRNATLFLSFDEWAEVQRYGWIREATSEEIAELRAQRALGDARVGGRDDAKDDADWTALFLDQTGRPYLIVTVTRDAPGHVWRQATGHLRIFRFRGDA